MRAFWDNLKLALGSFVANPLRSLLTLLGIMIGVATVVAAMGLIEGLRLKVNRDLSFFGANVFELSKWPSVSMGPMDWRKFAKRKDFTIDDLRAVSELPDVAATSASAGAWGQKVSTQRAETRPSVSIIGATSMWLDTSALSVTSGRFFNDTDDFEARPVIVLGTDVVDALFPHQDPLGQEVRIRGRPLTVVGVLQRRGSFMGMVSMDSLVVLPLAVFQRLYGEEHSPDLDIQAADSSVLEKAQDEVVALMRQRRGVPPDEENDFELSTNESNTKQFNEFSQLVSTAGFGVCVLSLIVGGIGILNIMLVSVTERTREIGIRKALGAKRRRILAQFSTEAVVLSLVGGAIGIFLGFGVAALVRWVTGIPAQVPVWAVLLAVGMSSGVGLVFGIYPAARAAKLDPVEAMRSE